MKIKWKRKQGRAIEATVKCHKFTISPANDGVLYLMEFGHISEVYAGGEVFCWSQRKLKRIAEKIADEL